MGSEGFAEWLIVDTGDSYGIERGRYRKSSRMVLKMNYNRMSINCAKY
jgi:hypothetical protein